MSNITTTNETTPSTPSSGKTRIYVENSTKKIESIDDAGVVSKYVTEASDKVMVSSNDTTADYLENKITASGTGLSITTLNDGGDEDVQITIATLDEDDMASDSDTSLATQQSIKAYVDALGGNPANTFTVSSSGADYTTIQAALTANATANALFIVYPGTYTNDTINFTANAQTVMTPSKGNNVIVTNSSQVVGAGDFTGCKIKNIRINFTPTTAINGIEVNDGSLSMDSCKLDLTTSSAIAGATQPALLAVTGTGSLTTKFGEFTYQHTGNTTNGIKAMFNIATGGKIDCLRPCESSMTNSGTAAATSLAIDAGTAVIRITNACNFVITDTTAAVVAGLGYIGGSGSNEFEYCKIKIVGGGSNACYGIYNGGTGSIRSAHNIIEVASGATNYGFFTGGSATTTSIVDDIRAADGNVSTGTFITASSDADGALTLRRAADPHLRLINLTKEDIEGGRESSVIFKGLQSGGEETTLAEIQASHDGTSDDQKGDLIFYTNDGTDGDSPTERLRIDSAGLTTATGTFNATTAIQLNGTSINTGGTLTNVAYLDQANAFTVLQTIDQNADAIGMTIDSEASTGSNYGLNIETGQGARVLRVYEDADNYASLGNELSNALGSHWFYRNAASAATAGPVMFIEQDNSGDDQPALQIQQDGSGAALYVASGGVGLGINSPTGLLHIVGIAATSDQALIQSDVSSRATISFRTGTSSSRYWVGERQNDGSGFGISYGTSSATSNGLFIDTSGNVGIGIATPDAEALSTFLHIANTANNLAGINITGGDGADESAIGTIEFSDPGNTDERLVMIAGRVNGSNATPGGDLEFWTQPDSGTLTNRMIIDSSGNVGIGMTPAYKLDVSGDIRWGTANEGILTYDGTNAYVQAKSGGSLIFRTNNGAVEAVRANTLGVINIGGGSVSQSATRALGQLFEVNKSAGYGGMSLNTWSTTDSHGPVFDFNKSGHATVGSHTTVNANEKLGYIIFRGSDGTAFRDAAVISADVDGTPGASDMPGRLTFSTTADGAAVATERMRITSAGYVGVGTTSPSARFHVLQNGGENLRLESNTNDSSRSWGLFTETQIGGDLELKSSSTRNGTPDQTVMYFQNAGNVKIAGTALRGTTEGTNHLDIFDGTAPVGTLANGISLYSTSGELRVMDAAGNATLLSPHDSKTNEWIYDSVDTTTGKHLRIDMERMMKAINEKFGWDFVKEFTE